MSTQPTRRRADELCPIARIPGLRPESVLNVVGWYFGVDRQELLGSRRTNRIVGARHWACFLLRRCCGMALSEIGSMVGGRDHTTVLNSLHQIGSLRARASDVFQDILLALEGPLKVTAAAWRMLLLETAGPEDPVR